MNITLLKYPTDEDWAFAKQCALVTIGKEMKTAPDMEWKHSILRAQHSPIRTLQFAFCLEGVPYWVSTHLARHVHAQPFIRSQRNDRENEYDDWAVLDYVQEEVCTACPEYADGCCVKRVMTCEKVITKYGGNEHE